MTPADNAAAMRTFTAHSTARESIAAAIAHRWRHLARPSRPQIFDLGTGDGTLLAQILTKLDATCAIRVVEPDDRLAPLAVQHLRDHGHEADRVFDFPAGAHAGAYLAAHVLFYLPDIPQWFTTAAAQLSPAGVLSCVLRAPACDCYMLRRLVRQHLGLELRVTPEHVRDLAADHRMGTDTVTVSSTFTYPVTDPRLVPFPAESADPDLARLICWLAGLPTDRMITASLRQAINEFLEHRLSCGSLVLSQTDLLITAAHAQRLPEGQPADPKHIQVAQS